MKNNILAVIPARGGSKEIPRKNVRFLAGKPLICYAIENCLKSKYIDKTIVSTDDEEIAHIAEISNAEIVKRPDKLSKDEITLDPVIHHAVTQLERQNDVNYSIILTIQPTSPLINTETIDKGIVKFIKNKVDTMISVVDDRHLSWTKKDDHYIPNYKKRKNRQYLPPNYIETGAILITKGTFITKKSRFGGKIDLLELPKDQAVDIDSEMDWWIAEKLLKRKKVLIRVDGYDKIGLGHIYRMLLLANRLIDHDLLFVTKNKYSLGIDFIKKKNYPLQTFESFHQYKKIVSTYNPDIVINDILDTEYEYINFLKKKNIFVVNFEDMGTGADIADVVINALYDEKYPKNNHYWGESFYCLREEFYLIGTKQIEEKVKEVLISFGGTDHNNYTKRILSTLSELNLDLNITIILGLGYNKNETLNPFINNTQTKIKILKNINNISKYMLKSDIAFTSAGRTVYELASIGTPTIVLAQNNRELRHTFAKAENGIINLKLGYKVSDEDIRDTFINLKDNYKLRKRCNKLMLKHNLKSGLDNTINLIFREFYKYEKEGRKY